MNSVPIDYCGWDIGGAHLKFVGIAASGQLIAAEQLKCPLWLGIENLIQAIQQIKGKYYLGKAEHAITMTGELCDNFKDRDTGVSEIIKGISGELESRSSSLYGTDGQWYTLSESVPWQSVASANWHASARFVGRRISSAIVIDFGSTTVDIIPVVNGRVVAKGYDDFSRLKYRELVYTGMARTPVSTIARYLPFDGEMIPTSAESFSNTADVYRILGSLPESADLYPTMDGGSKTRSGSARRLFRMIGRDFDGEFPIAELMAKHVSDSQLKQISDALAIVAGDLGPETTIVGLGCGAQLLERIALASDAKYLVFDDLFHSNGHGRTECSVSVCAPAAAVASELRFLRASKMMA